VGGRIWLGLAEQTRSLRRYPGLGDIWRMIARSAYTQLDYSPLRLAATILGMMIAFVAPPLLALTAGAEADVFGGLAWLIMTLAFVPISRHYGRPLVAAPLLPFIALFYLAATVDS